MTDEERRKSSEAFGEQPTSPSVTDDNWGLSVVTRMNTCQFVHGAICRRVRLNPGPSIRARCTLTLACYGLAAWPHGHAQASYLLWTGPSQSSEHRAIGSSSGPEHFLLGFLLGSFMRGLRLCFGRWRRLTGFVMADSYTCTLAGRSDSIALPWIFAATEFNPGWIWIELEVTNLPFSLGWGNSKMCHRATSPKHMIWLDDREFMHMLVLSWPVRYDNFECMVGEC